LTSPEGSRTITDRGKRSFRPININMKRVIAIAATFVVAGSYVAAAQAPSQPPAPTLAEVAKAEEERRKAVKRPAKVYTNANLASPDVVTLAPPSTSATAPGAGNATPANTSPTFPAGQAPPPADPGAMKDQAYWSGRMSAARADLSRTQLFADSLQTRINSLRTDFVNRDNPVEKAKIEQDLNTALAELEKVRKELEAKAKAITAIEDEARRANVPSGWLRSPE
jgi:hypothetical protein